MGYFLVILCLAVSPTIVFGNDQKLIFDGFKNAVNTYSEKVDKSVNWTIIYKSINNLKRNTHVFYAESGHLLGEIVTHTQSAKDKYFDASSKIYHWCEASSSYVTAYLELFDTANITNIQKAVDAQKQLMNKILTDGVDKMKSGITYIGDAKGHLLIASGKFAELDVSIEYDGRQRIQQFEDQIHQKRTQSYTTFSIGIVAGIIAVAVTEALTVPKLRKQIDSSKDALNCLHEQISDAVKAIKGATESMEREMDHITRLQAKTENTEFFMNLSILMIKAIKEAAHNILNECQEFSINHGGGTNG